MERGEEGKEIERERGQKKEGERRERSSLGMTKGVEERRERGEKKSMGAVLEVVGLR